jgi:hypothetical protein
MYDLKIFDNMQDLWKFLIDHNIKDYTFKRFDFQFMDQIKTNYFLSYKS